MKWLHPEDKVGYMANKAITESYNTYLPSFTPTLSRPILDVQASRPIANIT